MLSIFSHNGIIKPLAEANMPLANIAYAYGYGVYENIRVKDGMPFFVKQHIERLQRSAKIIGLEHKFSSQQITTFVDSLIRAVQTGRDLSQPSQNTLNLKLLLVGGRTPSDADLYILPLAPKFTDRKLYRHGVTTITATLERPFPQAKTLSMLGSYLAYTKAQKNNCYDALLLNRDNHIIEGTRTNFFTIKNKTIFTAPADEVLEGVTKTVVLHLAKEKGYQVEEANITPADVSAYDGAFLTSTSSKILPIISINAFSYPEIAPSIKELMRIHDDFLKTCKGEFIT